MKIGWILLAVCVLMAGAASCVPANATDLPVSDTGVPMQTATSVTPAGDSGCLQGALPAALEQWPDTELNIYAAPFQGNEQNEGFYVLDSNTRLRTVLEVGGEFALCGIPPGKYVLVAGPSPEDSLVLLGDGQDLLIVDVTAGTTLRVEPLLP